MLCPLCKPIDDGGVGIRDLSDVIYSFQMKFVWRLMTVNDLKTSFFKAIYLRSDHFATSMSNKVGLGCGKPLKEITNVYENVYVKLQNGHTFFWYDHWIKSGPLAYPNI